VTQELLPSLHRQDVSHLLVVLIPWTSLPQCSSPYHTKRWYISSLSEAEMSQSRCSLISVGSHGLMIAPRPDRQQERDERVALRGRVQRAGLTDHGAVAESDLLPGEVTGNEVLVGGPVLVREDVSIP
jgi:hypothetical protein